MTENNSPLERLLDWCAGEVASIRLSEKTPSTGEIDDEVRQEIEQVEADMRAAERDYRSLVDAYGAAVQELQRLGAKSVPLAYHQPPRHGLEEFERNLRRSMATAMQIPEHMLGPLPAPQVYEVLAASVRSKGSGGGEPEPDAVLGMRAIRGQFQSERSVPPRREALEASLADVSILVQAWRESNSEVPAAIIEAAEARLRRALEQQNSAENKHSYAVPEAEQQPVAFQFGKRFQYVANHWPPENCNDPSVRPLYAAPPPVMPEAVRRLPDKWRSRALHCREVGQNDRIDGHTLQAQLMDDRAATFDGRADELEAALAQHSEPGRIPEGWKLVPVEPTKEMCRANLVAADESILANKMRDNEEAYKAMIASAPEPDERNDQ